jgi:glycosyltransferase involved in cell wall biosynthesis
MALQEKGGAGCVRVVGEVPDVRPYVLAADMAIAPLQIARGIQNKVLEALACGKPVIATEQAATGIDCQDGLLIARSVDDWVLWMLQLSDPENHASRSRGAREEILKKYSWSAKLAPFAELLNIPVGADESAWEASR